MAIISRSFSPAGWSESLSARPRSVMERRQPPFQRPRVRTERFAARPTTNRRRAMSRVVHFEIPAENPERAAVFYKKTFGWKVEKWPGPMEYWMVNTGSDSAPGINGGVFSKRNHFDPPKRNTLGTCDT